MKIYFAFIAILFFLFSCKKEESVTSISDCVFEQVDEAMDGLIDDDERAIMESCRESRLLNLEDIQSNIIGTWELIGHGEGWVPSISQPCASIEISETELRFTFSNANIDISTLHSWEIIEASPTAYYLQAAPPAEGLYSNIFCEEYMYIDATPADGNMYLYQKVN